MEKSVWVAAIQLNSCDDRSVNLETIRDHVRMAAAAGAELIALPEYAAYLSDEGNTDHMEDLNGPTLSTLRELAQAHGVYLQGGSFMEKSAVPEVAYSTSPFIGPDGCVQALYRKIHLFDVCLNDGSSYRESSFLKAGKEVVVCPSPFGVMGFSICYDLRFPELYRELADHGAGILFVPAAFTQQTGRDHWEVLLRARAVENQAFVVAAAQWGPHPVDRMCFGESMIVDPWGTVLATAPPGPGMALACLDLQRIAAVRRAMPCLAHRRLTGRREVK